MIVKSMSSKKSKAEISICCGGAGSWRLAPPEPEDPETAAAEGMADRSHALPCCQGMKQPYPFSDFHLREPQQFDFGRGQWSGC